MVKSRWRRYRGFAAGVLVGVRAEGRRPGGAAARERDAYARAVRIQREGRGEGQRMGRAARELPVMHAKKAVRCDIRSGQSSSFVMERAENPMKDSASPGRMLQGGHL